MLAFEVDEDLCSRCGDCAKACCFEVIEQVEGKLPQIRADREFLCNRCQQCLAVCPRGAVSIHSKRASDSIEICEGAYPDKEQMILLVRGRRSVRHYRTENVSKSLIRELLSTVANAPTGNNNQRLTFTILDDIRIMRRFQERMITSLSAALGQSRKKQDWFIDNVGSVVLEKGPSSILCDAPHLLIVSSPLEVYTSREDVIIALSYFELLAQSAGLGTLWCGMAKSMLESLPDLKKLLDIPEQDFYFPMLFGLPAIKYHRTAQRDESAAIQKVRM